jgi:Ser/Thr protein kinase RdoA (MazF antagonist)
VDKRIRELYDDSILDEALARYGIAKDEVQLLDGFESYIYEYRKDGKRYVLRVSHSLHRASDAIQGELEWLNYLVDGGVPAARAVRSERGSLVEPIPVADGSHFTAVSFEWAQGDHATREQWQSGLPVRLGQIVGRMHALTKDFEPSEPRFKRHAWYDDYPEGFAERYLSPDDGVVVEKLDQVLVHLYELPQDRDSYGLIHVDVHGGNFFVDGEGQITLFDFDDCQYAWFAYDIAMALFYAISHDCVSEEDVAQAKGFFEQFMQGYRRENEIDPQWLAQVPYFLKLREIDLYILIHRSLDIDNLDPWCASYMKDRKRKIAHDVPYVVLDWERYVEGIGG